MLRIVEPALTELGLGRMHPGVAIGAIQDGRGPHVDGLPRRERHLPRDGLRETWFIVGDALDEGVPGEVAGQDALAAYQSAVNGGGCREAREAGRRLRVGGKGMLEAVLR